jgi:saccharopine dehydrogenase-like NADP-dependent oxidoreductase
MAGSMIAKDLAMDFDFDVAIADINESAFQPLKHYRNIQTVAVDLSNPDTIKNLVKDYDMVCGAMPSRFGLHTMRAVIESGKNFCDISFMPEDAAQLDSLAKANGVTVVYDCGVAPGMSHILVGFADSNCDELVDVKIYVGGIPRENNPPWFYKAAFAPSDVLEEYTRPVMLVKNSQVIEKEALSDREMMEFPGAGILEAFNTDGLRSLVKTTSAANMVEKTMRYSGHVDLIITLRDAGFFSKDTVDIGGVDVVPLNVTEKLLFPHWKYDEGEEDMTIMRVIVEGRKSGKVVRYSWDMLDYYDRATNTTSMARTTAFPCAIVARMMMNGEFHNPGVNPPESIGKVPSLLDKMLKELEGRDVAYLARVEGE